MEKVSDICHFGWSVYCHYGDASHSVLIILVMTILTLTNSTVYHITVLVNGGSAGAIFDDSYHVYLEDSNYGKVYIAYDEGLEDYTVNAEFTKAGKTNLILEDANGNKTVFVIDILERR